MIKIGSPRRIPNGMQINSQAFSSAYRSKMVATGKDTQIMVINE